MRDFGQSTQTGVMTNRTDGEEVTMISRQRLIYVILSVMFFLTSTVVQGENLLLFNDFTQEKDSAMFSILGLGEEVSGGKVEEGEYSLDFNGGSRAIVLSGGDWDSWNYSIEVKAKLVEQRVPYDQIGIIFRAEDLKNFYKLRLQLNEQRLYLEKIIGGRGIELDSVPFRWKPKEWYVFKAEICGKDSAQIRCYLNNIGMIEYTDSDPIRSGKVGLCAHGHAHFDDLKVYRIERVK